MGSVAEELPQHLTQFPQPDPFVGLKLPALPALPDRITRRWPPVSAKLMAGDAAELATLPVDHAVGVVDQRGGPLAARQRLQRFLDRHLAQYAEIANEPNDDARSGLSPYLHFGHISSYELFQELMSRERWTPARLAPRAHGKREGWWGASPGAEAWLDEFITWRECSAPSTTSRHS